MEGFFLIQSFRFHIFDLVMKKITYILLILTSFSFGQTFTEESQSIGIQHIHIDTTLMGGGAAFFDMDNDGFIDLYLTGGENQDQIYHNNQNGTFTEVGTAAGINFTQNVKTTGVTTGDINNDGFRDLFITTNEEHHNLLLLNNGDNTFNDISLSAGIQDTAWSTSATFGDVNLDGYLDIYVSNYVSYLQYPFFDFLISGISNYLYLNNGNGTFSEASISTSTSNNGATLASAFTNFDNDNDIDIFLANDFGSFSGGNALYQNQGTGSNFINIATSSGIYAEINGMGVAIGDYDEDSDFDYYITNMMGNLLHTNNNDATFNEDAFTNGVISDDVVSWGTFFFDYNNNTYLDLFTSSGGIMNTALPQQNKLFQNQQNGTFLNVSTAEGIIDVKRSRGAIHGDIDNDGDLDIVTVNVEYNPLTSENISVYKNNLGNGNNWLQISLIGTTSNKDAFGSKIEVFSNGRSWIREIGGGSSYLSQNTSVAHFGLGNYTTIDSVKIKWPNGNIQVETGVNVNQHLLITELDFTGINESTINNWKIHPNPAKNLINITKATNDNLIGYKIFNSSGRLIESISDLAETPKYISLENLENGFYQLLLIGEKNSYSRKLVLIH